MNFDQYLEANKARLVREAEELDRCYREADTGQSNGEDYLDELNRGYAQDRISRSRL